MADEQVPEDLEIADELIAERRNRKTWGNTCRHDVLAKTNNCLHRPLKRFCG